MIKNAKLKMQLSKSTYPNATNNKKTKNRPNMCKSVYQSKELKKAQSKSKRSSRQGSKSKRNKNKQKVLSKLYESTFRCMRQYSLKNSFDARNGKSQNKPYICYEQDKKQSEKKFVNNRQLIKKLNFPIKGNHTISHSNVVDRLSFLNKIEMIYNHVIKEKQYRQQKIQNKQYKQYLPSFIQYFLGDAIYTLKRQSISKFQFEKMCLDSYYKAEQDDVKLFMGQHMYLQNDHTQNSGIKPNSRSLNSRISLENSKKSIKASQTIKPSPIKKNKLSISNNRQIRNSDFSKSRELKQRRNTFDFGLLQPNQKNSASFKANTFSAIQQNTASILQTFRNTTNCFPNHNNQNKQNESKTKNVRESRLWQREKRKYYFQNLQKKQTFKENQTQDLTLQRIQFKLNSYLQKVGNSIDNKSRFLQQNFDSYMETQQKNKRSRFLML